MDLWWMLWERILKHGLISWWSKFHFILFYFNICWVNNTHEKVICPKFGVSYASLLVECYMLASKSGIGKRKALFLVVGFHFFSVDMLWYFDYRFQTLVMRATVTQIILLFRLSFFFFFFFSTSIFKIN